MSGYQHCTTYSWCDVDHAQDQDDFEAQYHKQSRSGVVIEYSLVLSEGRAYAHWQDYFDVTIDVNSDAYIGHLMIDIGNMRTALIEFERSVRPVRRRTEVDDALRELDA